jgi:hypothetical protein
MVRDLERMQPSLSAKATRAQPSLDYKAMVTTHNKRLTKR